MIENILAAFSFRTLQECKTLMLLLKSNGIPQRKFFAYMKDKVKAKPEAIEATDLKTKKRLRVIPQCPKCRTYLILRESANLGFEAEWACTSCTYTHLLEVSVADQHLLIRAEMSGVEPDFKASEIRASRDEREKRRGVCLQCRYLKGAKCKACGCRMKHRTYYEILTCPKKFW